MAFSRTPLTELGSQGHNRRKMASQQKTYGKGKGKIVHLPPLWESPRGEKNSIGQEKSPKKKFSDEEREITHTLANTNIATQIDSGRKKVDFTQQEKWSGQRQAISTSPTRRSARFLKPKIITPDVAPIIRAAELDVDVLLAESRVGRVKSFTDFADALKQKYEIKKLADGSFGDVYKLFCRPGSSVRAREKLERIGGVVFKVIPLAAKTGEGSRKYTKVEEALGEIRINKALDAIHGFTRFRDVQIVRGKYPPSFLEAWREHQKINEDSSSLDPEKAFKDSQTYAILDMDDAGKELMRFDGLSIFQAYDIFFSCAIILANGEANVQFESRDMHVSNICLQGLNPMLAWDISYSRCIQWPVNQTNHLGHSNVRVTLIDYTLSRAVLDGAVAYTDLNKRMWLFRGVAGGEEDLQSRAYRQMDVVARIASGGKTPDWSKFFPATNLVWLEYLLEMLLTTLLHDEIIEGSNEACIAVQREMRAKLYSVLKALKVAIWEPTSGIKSAEGLLEAAVEKKWLCREELDAYIEKIQS